MRALSILILLAMALAACSRLEVKDLEKGEKGIVAGVSDGDTLTLEGGLKVQLTGIEAPRQGWPLEKEARAQLEKLAGGREAQLFYGGTKRYRETTALAQVYVRSEGGRWIWLQEAMVAQGFARAKSWKDNHARSAELLAAEQRARAARRGIWANPYYTVRTIDAVEPKGYQLVEGQVTSVGDTAKMIYLNFSPEWKTDFTATISKDDINAFAAAGLDPLALNGARVRLRGYVREKDGPSMRIDHPQQIEVLAKGAPAPAVKSTAPAKPSAR